jgi:hypothetical protein
MRVEELSTTTVFRFTFDDWLTIKVAMIIATMTMMELWITMWM